MLRKAISLMIAVCAAAANAAVKQSLAAADGQLLNGSFERVDAEGHVTDWAYGTKHFSVDPSGGRNGTSGMKYEGSGGAMLLQRVRVEPGTKYKVGVWVRPDGLKGDGFCARICVLWEDEFGLVKDGLGFYETPKIKGTKDWTLCAGGPAVAPKNAVWATIRPEVVPPCSGRVWFDDVFFEPYSTRAVESVYTSAYRDEQASGVVRLAASLNPLVVPGPAERLKGLFVFQGNAGMEKSFEASGLSANRAEASVDVSDIPLGKSTLVFRLTDVSGKELGRAERTFVRTAEERPRRVTFDRLGRTLVDGKPFFPLGMYWSVSKPYHKFQLPKINEQTIAEFAKGPFNCVMPYQPPDRKQMDLIHRHGIMVIRSLISTFDERGWDPSGRDAAHRYPKAAVKAIGELKDHPALLAWYLNDESPLSMLENLKGRLRTVRELDPDHPGWSVLYQWQSVREYMETFDVIGTDPYPVGGLPLSMAWKMSDATREATFGFKPRWQVPQAFDWSLFRKTCKEDRMPTREEMANMVWQNVAGGANGLVLYSYTYLMQNPAVPFERGWADVCAAGQEVRDHFDMLLAGDEPPAFSVDGVGIVARTWREGDAIWVLAVNTEAKSVTGSVTVRAEIASPTVEMGSGFGGLRGGKLDFKLGPMGRTIVKAKESVSVK